MKKIKLLLIASIILATTGCANTHDDGTYRGFYSDQVEVEFKLESNIVTSAKYRVLSYKGTDYNKSNETSVIEMKEEHEALLTHLIDKDITSSLDDLHTPSDIELAGATIRSNKVRSAIQDGLNRGAYNLAK